MSLILSKILFLTHKLFIFMTSRVQIEINQAQSAEMPRSVVVKR